MYTQSLSTGVLAMATSITLFVCGDVMTGRGIDQVLPQSVDPQLYESYVKDARRYVTIAERENGSIPDSVNYQYVWGEALAEFGKFRPDYRLINLETSITTSDNYSSAKGIHYRMHPDNVQVLTAAGIDYCSLGNNHVMDWGVEGLRETLSVLSGAGISYSGAGVDESQASAPAAFSTESGTRLLVFSCGAQSAGVPLSWAPSADESGVNVLTGMAGEHTDKVVNAIHRARKPGDIVVFSIHWGGNWGYEVPTAQQQFARRLIDEAGVDLIVGHSSHHFKGIEVYQDRLVLYGCGDFINDYEGISGMNQYRDDLALMYFPTLNVNTGVLEQLLITPLQIMNFRLNNALNEDIRYVLNTLIREGKPFGTGARLLEHGRIQLTW